MHEKLFINLKEIKELIIAQLIIFIICRLTGNQRWDYYNFWKHKKFRVINYNILIISIEQYDEW
jgi:hypothetical protein